LTRIQFHPRSPLSLHLTLITFYSLHFTLYTSTFNILHLTRLHPQISPVTPCEILITFYSSGHGKRPKPTSPGRRWGSLPASVIWIALQPHTTQGDYECLLPQPLHCRISEAEDRRPNGSSPTLNARRRCRVAAVAGRAKGPRRHRHRLHCARPHSSRSNRGR
jgi:hypothetical protein